MIVKISDTQVLVLDEDEREKNKFTFSAKFKLEDCSFYIQLAQDKNIILYKANSDINMINLNQNAFVKQKTLFSLNKKEEAFFSLEKETGTIVFCDNEKQDEHGNSTASIVLFDIASLQYK